jgi:hypothetical protein
MNTLALAGVGIHFLHWRKSMWRQGDVLIQAVDEIPSDAIERGDLVLAEGELTGHAHRIADHSAAKLYQLGTDFFLNVIADRAVVVHEEHGPIALGPGIYRVWRQREYVPSLIRKARWVRD